MPYTEASIRESTRIYPITPLGIPRTCVVDTTLGGYFIPKGTLMLPCFWSAHRDLNIWKDPEEFQPERFLDEKRQLLKKDFTIAFGAGNFFYVFLKCSLKNILQENDYALEKLLLVKIFS